MSLDNLVDNLGKRADRGKFLQRVAAVGLGVAAAALGFASRAAAGSCAVRYRRLDTTSDWIKATVIAGSLPHYTGPSWASRMAFQPGCWEVRGRVEDVTLSFIIRVEATS